MPLTATPGMRENATGPLYDAVSAMPATNAIGNILGSAVPFCPPQTTAAAPPPQLGLTDMHKQTTYCLNTPTNMACIAGVNREGVGISWQKCKEEVEGTASYPV